VRYGAEAKVILAKYYPWIGVAVAVGIIVFVIMRKVLKRDPAAAVERTLETGN
jgi:hypothetical protein